MAYATLRYQQTLTMTACLLTLLLSIPCSLFPIPYSLSSQITFMAYATLRYQQTLTMTACLLTLLLSIGKIPISHCFYRV